MLKPRLFLAILSLFVGSSVYAANCEDLVALNKRCEQQIKSFGDDVHGSSSNQIFGAMKEAMREVKKDCPHYAKAESCSKELAHALKTRKPKSSPYKVGAEVGLQSFGMELMNSVEKPSNTRSPASNRSPASSR